MLYEHKLADYFPCLPKTWSWVNIDRRKKAAAYHMNLSAVKNTHKEKRGIDAKTNNTPENAVSFGFDL